MKRAFPSICLAMASLLAGCGDYLADNDYPGEVLASVRGDLQIEPTERPNDTLQITLVWAVEGLVDYRVNQNVALDGAQLGHYTVEILTPPPDAALGVDPETGGRLGFANVFAYDDPRGEGPIDLGDYDPSQYGDLLFRMRGGSPNVMVAYAKDDFPAGSNVARELGGPIAPGFFLVRFSGDCLCPFSDDSCRDSTGSVCDVRSELSMMPIETNVDLTIVDDISTFAVHHAPDWLFF